MFSEVLKSLRRERGVSQQLLAEAMGVSQQAVGKWEAGKSTPDPSTVARIADFFAVTADRLLGVDNAPRGYDEVAIPVVGTVRAGYGALAFEEDCGVEYARVKDPENYFFLVVRGESMQPRIFEGDLALVRRQNDIESGELGVVIYGEGEGTLKRVIKRPGSVVLEPFNPDFPKQVIMGPELSEFRVIGRVVETKAKW